MDNNVRVLLYGLHLLGQEVRQDGSKQFALFPETVMAAYDIWRKKPSASKFVYITTELVEWADIMEIELSSRRLRNILPLSPDEEQRFYEWSIRDILGSNDWP